MRLRALPVAACLLAGCVAPTRHMLGRDPMPPEAPPATRDAAPAARDGSPAAAVPALPGADPAARARLPAPHRDARPSREPPPPALDLRTPLDLREAVGQRDRRSSLAAAITWTRQLGRLADLTDDATLADLLAWAERRQRLAGAIYPPEPGDLLLFDRTDSDAESDLVAIVLARDPRGVIELVYTSHGIIRRGFADPTRRRTHREPSGAIVNTYLRHGKRWPPAGTRYLAGELLAHVIRTH